MTIVDVYVEVVVDVYGLRPSPLQSLCMTRTAFTWPAGKRAAVSLSFDDARISQIDAGIPILDRHNVKATFYLTPSRVPERMAGWQQAVVNGHEMGNHTVSHPCSGNFIWSRNNALEDYTIDRMEQELLDANAYIQSELGVTPQSFAYCCGQKYVGRGKTQHSFVPLIAKHFIAGRGFRDEDANDPTFVDLAQLYGVDGDSQPFDKLRFWIDKAAQQGGWLVFAAHDVGDFPRQAMPAEVLNAVCAYCTESANGIWIDTVAAIGQYVYNWQNGNKTAD
jgi:peptidoglycan/xylan/chitin deacetylase (PgdA/CDA1 family)